jgi:protein-tyrosine phosphatase
MHLTLAHRPRVKDIPKMRGVYDYVVVLLKPTENAVALIHAYREARVEAHLVSFTVGLANKAPMTWDETAHVRRAVELVSRDLNQGDSVLVHCSAGIHRTGTFAYAVLRHMGYTQDEALAHIQTLREVTYLGMLPFVDWAEQTLVDPAWVYDGLEA